MNKILIISILIISNLFAYRAATDPFEMVNNFRYSLNMVPLQQNSYLEKSARNHAFYIYYNKDVSHYEKRYKNYFTGVNPWDRANYVGYKSRFVSENLSAGNDAHDGVKSIEGLFAAIYHRFGFLSFDINELGYAKKHGVHVYNMGNSWIRRACETNKKKALQYVDICKNNTLPYIKYKKALDRVRRSNPKLIIYPLDEQKNVPTVFYEESPDPLPNYSESGYPVSISFNPYFYNKTKITPLSFTLKDVRNSKVELIKHRNGSVIFQKKNDPNNHLKETEFAIFPKNRLNYNSVYYAKFKYKYNNRIYTKKWLFHTKKLSNLYTYKNQDVKLKLNRVNHLYIPLKYRNQVNFNQIRYKCDSRNIKFSIIDENTLKITNEYQSQPITCLLDANKMIRITLR